MDIQRLEDRIRGRLNNFPVKTRRVAEYILSNSSEIAFHSISETAEALSVSRAQLVRVSRMLGFEGYADLKNTLKKNLMSQVIPSVANTGLENGSDLISPLNGSRTDIICGFFLYCSTTLPSSLVVMRIEPSGINFLVVTSTGSSD